MFPSGGDGIHLVVDEFGNFREDNFSEAIGKLGGQTWASDSVIFKSRPLKLK